MTLAVESGCTIVVRHWLELKTLAGLRTKQESSPQPPVPSPSPSPDPHHAAVYSGIECHTHEYIRTGHLDSKFGFDPNQLEEVFAFITQQPNYTV
jgi:diaminopimelate decarboxylase